MIDIENKILQGDIFDKIKDIPDKSVQCVVTSPPYWNLRDYQTAEWVGGDISCSHFRASKLNNGYTDQWNPGTISSDGLFLSICKICGAKRIDKQIGLEKTVEEYINKMVLLSREIKRILKDDGTFWLNLGDTYYGNSPAGKNKEYEEKHNNLCKAQDMSICTLASKITEAFKPKDMVGVPWSVAFALRNDGWWLRQEIIWHKPNASPSSVTDRCTTAHEHLFLLSKSQKYFFDYKAIQEDAVTFENRPAGFVRNREKNYNSKENNNPEAYRPGYQKKPSGWDSSKGNHNGKSGRYKKSSKELTLQSEKRNKRSVWTIPTKPYTEAHFATFPPDLIVPCIKAGSKEGDIVFDPFMGSGTTAHVARLLNRNYLGIELNANSIKLCKKRLQQERLPL